MIGLELGSKTKGHLQVEVNEDSNSMPLKLGTVTRLRRDHHTRVQCDLAAFLVKKMLQCGVRAGQIGIITPYNSQRKYLNSKLRKPWRVPVMTVDKSQGIDRDCILLLFPENAVNRTFLNSWERINVAFTRAKSKLIIVGNY